jgi:predicted RNase H-like nuclease (RuvC/YqgF family)
MQQRASLDNIFSGIMKPSQNEDDLKIYQGVSLQKKFSLLRKQYDQKMKHFQQVMVSQSKEISQLQSLIEELQKEQSPEYQKNLENINENFT